MKIGIDNRYPGEDKWTHLCYVEIHGDRFICRECQIHSEAADAIVASPWEGFLSVSGVEYRWRCPRTIDSDWDY